MKNNLPHIVLCTEAGPQVGLGHAVRCESLLNAFKGLYRLSIFGNNELLFKKFPNARHFEVTDWKNFSWARFRIPGVDLVVADIPFYRPRNWLFIRHPSAPLVVIDDHGGNIPAEVIINGTVLNKNHFYQKNSYHKEILLGSKYSLLRPNFSCNPWSGFGSKIVTIVIGSGIEANVWINNLLDLDNLNINAKNIQLVVGQSFILSDKFIKACKRHDLQLSIGISGEYLAEMLASSEVVLITGGMILYEAIATGVPTVTFPQIPDLSGEAAWFAAKGACIDLGIKNSDPYTAVNNVNKLLENPKLQKNMSAKQRALIDGKGVSRCSKILSTFLGM